MQREQKVPLRDRIDWRPQPRQADALAACGLLDYYLHDGPITYPVAPIIGYGGAAGGGKTDTGLMVGRIIADAVPGAQVGFFRRTYPELEGAEGPIQRAQALFIRDKTGEYNVGRHEWLWDNGSAMFFRHMNTLKDRYQQQGAQFLVLLIDEATHFYWQMIDFVLTRNRSTKARGRTKPFAMMMSNPGNVGHGWYSSLFDLVDINGGALGPHGQVKRVLTQNGTYEQTFFIPAVLQDNEILMRADPDYERKLRQRAPDLVDALLNCNWRVFAGQALKEWNRELHVVEPFDIPGWWPRWRSVDWGYSHPWVCLWWAKDPDNGRKYIYREAYETRLTDTQQAKLIIDMTPINERIIITWLDPSMYTLKNVENVVSSAALEYQKWGIMVAKADNSRIDGKRRLHRALGMLPDGKPGLQVFSTCVNVTRTFPLLVHDELHPEDVDTNGDDHPFDAAKYGLTGEVDSETPGEAEENQQQAEEYERLGRLL